MKKIISLLTIILMVFQGYAQVKSNVILFTDNGEKFTAILNGLRMNEAPATNVKITDLTGEFYKLKVIFDDKMLGEKSFNLNISMQQGMEITCNITKNKKGEYVMRYMGSVPVAQAPPPPKESTVIVYSENLPAESSTVTHQTTTATTTSGNPDNVSINMGVNVGGQGGSINMNVSGMDATTHSHSSTTVTHSTTTTTTSAPPPPPPAPVNYLPGYTGPIGCPVPLSPNEFSDLKKTISTKTFEDSKLTIAKQVVGSSCLFAAQVKELMMLFTYEATRLDMAKYAYRHTYDVGNYFKVNDAFTFESSIDELNEYIEANR